MRCETPDQTSAELVLGCILAAEQAHLLDEMELAVLASWIVITLAAVRISSHRFWRPTTAA